MSENQDDTHEHSANYELLNTKQAYIEQLVRQLDEAHDETERLRAAAQFIRLEHYDNAFVWIRRRDIRSIELELDILKDASLRVTLCDGTDFHFARDYAHRAVKRMGIDVPKEDQP